MPKLWTETIETHRDAVRDATLNATARLVAERGVRGVTMSQVAREAGIGRATLYKYFGDIEAILVAWHERQIAHHLQHLAALSEQIEGASDRLAAVLEAYALIQHEHRTQAGALHRGEHIARAEELLRGFIAGLVREAAESGEARRDVPAEDLAAYCLNAIQAASDLESKAAVRRLVDVTLTGLGPVS